MYWLCTSFVSSWRVVESLLWIIPSSSSPTMVAPSHLMHARPWPVSQSFMSSNISSFSFFVYAFPRLLYTGKDSHSVALYEFGISWRRSFGGNSLTYHGRQSVLPSISTRFPLVCGPTKVFSTKTGSSKRSWCLCLQYHTSSRTDSSAIPVGFALSLCSVHPALAGVKYTIGLTLPKLFPVILTSPPGVGTWCFLFTRQSVNLCWMVTSHSLTSSPTTPKNSGSSQLNAGATIVPALTMRVVLSLLVVSNL